MNDSKYWLDQVITAILDKHPEGEIVVSSGHSSSGVYHVGTLREILTAHLITWALKDRGRQARHIDVVDNFDALRKIPAGMPEDFKDHLGKPLYIAPDPFDCGHASYGDHFLSGLYESLERLGVTPELIQSHKRYQAGDFAPSIRRSLKRLKEVRKIITNVSRRELDEAWAPVQLLSDNDSLREWRFADWDETTDEITYTKKGGETGVLSLKDEPGRVKLDWRLDWPARWALYNVSVEPFGRDHATKGGSYDTGRELVQHIFGGTAPYPVPYEFVNMVGETKKMSKSAGNVVTPADMLDVVPTEVLRYFFAKPRPSRTLTFDPGVGLFNLLDEYSKAKQAFLTHEAIHDEAAIRYALGDGENVETISAVPFNHLVAVFQAAQGDKQKLSDILERTGYKLTEVMLAREAAFVANWLEKYAPESIKFSVQPQLPTINLTPTQRTFLQSLAGDIKDEGELDGQQMHEKIYRAKEAAGIKPTEAFQALYKVILGKDSGPKAGWFLASLDRAWLADRLQLKA